MIRKAALTACSNGQNLQKKDEISRLKTALSTLGVLTEDSPCLYAADGPFSGTPAGRAQALMDFFLKDDIEAVFDISGGDIANELLPFLDYDLIREKGKTFWGYSDLTALINAIYSMTGNSSVLYQVKNLIWEKGALQQQRFAGFLNDSPTDLFDLHYHFLRGSRMEGIVIGGNVRCLLKLAGTPYFPDPTGKILLLEALGGETAQLACYFAQMAQMGVFEKAAGILLGTFTRFEASGADRTVFDLLSPWLPETLPVAATPEIGHGADAKAIRIGSYARFLEVRTPGLVLQPLGMRFLESTNAYSSDPVNTEYMMFLPYDGPEETARFLTSSEKNWNAAAPLELNFAVLKDSLHAGTVTLYFEDLPEDTAELGWVLAKNFHGKGIAFEAAQALIRYASEELGIRHLIACCDSANQSSRHLMEKLGMKKTGEQGGRKNRGCDEERTELQYRLDPAPESMMIERINE